MSKRVNQNTKDIAKGDQFVVTTGLNLTDAGKCDKSGAKLTDCTMTHEVDKNGQKFVQADCTWFGLNDTGVAAIQDSLQRGGMAAGTKKIQGFQALVHEGVLSPRRWDISMIMVILLSKC